MNLFESNLFFFSKMVPGVVSSTTDHGFLINIGFSQRKGFLAKDKHLDEGEFVWFSDKKWMRDLDQLKFGFHGLFQIKESSTANSRIIPLKILDNKKPRIVCFVVHTIWIRVNVRCRHYHRQNYLFICFYLVWNAKWLWRK